MDDVLLKEVLLNVLEALGSVPGLNQRKLTELKLRVEKAGREVKKLEVDPYGEVIPEGGFPQDPETVAAAKRLRLVRCLAGVEQ